MKWIIINNQRNELIQHLYEFNIVSLVLKEMFLIRSNLIFPLLNKFISIDSFPPNSSIYSNISLLFIIYLFNIDMKLLRLFKEI
jgi:hypothetical protein